MYQAKKSVRAAGLSSTNKPCPDVAGAYQFPESAKSEFVVRVGFREHATFGGPKAKVAISNVSKTSVTIAIAIAVMNGEGKLVGVASGGTKLFPLRAERQMVYSLDFGGVSSALGTGTVFHFTVEPKP